MRIVTVPLKLHCINCKGTTIQNYKILERSLERVMNDDKFLQESSLFYVSCPRCKNSYAFDPAKLKTMIQNE